jgi:NTP pyrophosphatase (non-canonical NTP hydrolase)
MREELAELADEVKAGNVNAMAEEFGDLVFDIVLFASVLEEKTGVSLSKVCYDCTDKMIRRHPLVEERNAPH